MTRCLLSETHLAINTMGEVNPCCRYSPLHDKRLFLDGKTITETFNDPYLVSVRENLKTAFVMKVATIAGTKKIVAQPVCVSFIITCYSTKK